MAVLESDIRKGNVGNSDYSKHKIQPWDIWEEYNLNPWDADIVKRVLRTKIGDTRKMDYEKIIHNCQKCIQLIDKGSYIYDIILDRETNYNNHHLELTDDECKLLEEYRNKKKLNIANYRINDRVYIKNLEWFENNKTETDDIKSGNYYFILEQTKYCSRVATIMDVCYDYYKLDVDDGEFKWTDDMLESAE